MSYTNPILPWDQLFFELEPIDEIKNQVNIFFVNN